MMLSDATFVGPPLVTHYMCVPDTTLQASVKEMLKFLHQRSVNDTLKCFDSWILLTVLASRDMATFVSHEAASCRPAMKRPQRTITCSCSSL